MRELQFDDLDAGLPMNVITKSGDIFSGRFLGFAGKRNGRYGIYLDVACNTTMPIETGSVGSMEEISLTALPTELQDISYE